MTAPQPFPERYTQAVQDVAATIRAGVCLVRDEGGFWICSADAWKLAQAEMEALPELSLEEMEGNARLGEITAYEQLQSLIGKRSAIVSALNGQPRPWRHGDLLEGEMLVRSAFGCGLITAEQAKSLEFTPHGH